MTMTHTHTRTHVYIEFANPYLACDVCGEWVVGWHNPDKCGCDTFVANAPCACRVGSTSRCPSWNPVDGCACMAHLGSVGHAEPPVRQL